MHRIRDFYNKYFNNTIINYLLWAFFLNLFIETWARQKMPLYGGLYFMVKEPLVFFYNVLVILSTICIGLLFKRRFFVTLLISSVWITIGIVNGIILMQRMTPFTMKDMDSFDDALTIMTNYMSIKQIILLFCGIALVVALFIFLFIKGPKVKDKISIKKNIVVIILIIAATFGSTYGLIRINVLDTFFGNLAYAYEDYGVPYCFINTWLNQGIHKPHGYSKDKIKNIIQKSGIDKSGKVTLVKGDGTKKQPNILFLQLESFVDPTLFKDIRLSKDPIPYYRSLMKKYSSGSLTVPACGAGTANTEFEVMTGLSVKFFGPGEYPFKSVLKERTAESIARDLKNIGYSTHAVHNHRGVFYSRNEVFDNIGYDTFTSLEYMSDVEKTPKNWAKDNILPSQILEALKSTKGRDYVYTISVQGHGKYPSESLIAHPKIRVTKAANEETKNKYEYYVNQVYEMDLFVKDLINKLNKFGEPTVLVMYGDHIPALEMAESSYKAKDLYQTQYVIWDNIGMKKKDGDITAYELTAEVLNRLNIHAGTTFRYHQNVNHSSSNYLPDLKLLGYDMLYGKDYIYGGSNPFKKSGMKMGVKKIKIDKVVNVGGKYYIKGENFTEYSKVTLNGKALKTVYLGPTLLGLSESVELNDAAKMKVSQIDRSSNTIISTTE
ncbi:arylsulfatase [Eubacterium nodatum ATCC 33099]|nr:arylsulfatase [Eubacterium nodatum ATCC 33099]